MASGFLVGGILNVIIFFPLNRFSYEFIFSPPCLNHNFVLILVTPWGCYKSDMLTWGFFSSFVPKVRKIHQHMIQHKENPDSQAFHNMQCLLIDIILKEIIKWYRLSSCGAIPYQRAAVKITEERTSCQRYHLKILMTHPDTSPWKMQ